MAEMPVIPGLQIQPADDERLRIFFPYHPDNVARIRIIPGRHWHPQEKCWSIPHTPEALARLRQLFSMEPIRSFPRPAAVSKRRWEQLSPEEQSFIAQIEEELKLRGYSPPTRKSYRNHLLRFRRWPQCDPIDISNNEVLSAY